jgi:hypothetical protein
MLIVDTYNIARLLSGQCSQAGDARKWQAAITLVSLVNWQELQQLQLLVGAKYSTCGIYMC